MKKISIVLFALLMSVRIYAQCDNECNFKVNEVKLNLSSTIFNSYPEIFYDRLLDRDISVGASLGIALQKYRHLFDFSFMPHLRWYFGGNKISMERPGAGFFIEMNGALFSSTFFLNEKLFGDELNYGTGSKIGAGLGFGVGWKYVTKNNWVGEILMGGGRNFINNKNVLGYGYHRYGVSIGKRF